MKLPFIVKSTLFIYLTFTSFYSPNALADDDLLLGDLPIVISASRLNQSVLTSPSSVTVIDKTMIESSGFIEFVDLLRLVPGFQVAHIDGRRYVAVYHGNGSEISNRIQVLVNGRSTYTPTLSTVNWDSLGLQLEDIERIEVVRDTSASAFGSNSFTSAINIITRSPELDDKLHLKTRLGNKGERYGLFRTSSSTDNMHFRLSGSVRENDGFDDFADAREFQHLGLHGRIYTAENNPINLFLAYTDGETETRENADDLLERDRYITSWSAHIQGSAILSATQEFKWNLYHNRDDIDDLTQTRLLSELFGLSPAVFELLTGNPDTRTLEGSETNDSSKSDIEFTYNSSTNRYLQYIIGAGIRYDTLKSASYFRERGTLSDTTYRTFANIESPISSQLTLNSGLFYESTESYQTKASPRLSLNWEFIPNQSLRIAAARGYRLPSLLEKNFDTRTTLDNGFVIDERFISDPNLKPEKITSYDLALLGKLNSLPLSWDVKVYYEKISDIITYAEDSTFNGLFNDEFRVITNGGELENKGFEGEISYRPTIDSFVRLHFNIGESDYVTLEELNNSVYETEDLSSPRKSGGISTGFQHRNWQFNLGVYYIDDMRWFSQGEDVDGYTRIDTSISHLIKINSKNAINLKLAAQNIGDDHAEFGNDNDVTTDKLLFETRYYLSAELRIR